MSRGVLAFKIPEVRLFLKKLLCILDLPIQENAHPEPQIGDQPLVHVADFRHARIREAPAGADLLVFDVLQDTLDGVTDLLHVDREGDDVGPAATLALGQGLPRDLGQVELDGRVQLVDGVVTCTQLPGQREVVGPYDRHDAAQHGFDDVGLMKGLAGGARNGQ